MTQLNESGIDLSPAAIRAHIAAGRTERSMIVHRAVAAARVWLRRRPPLTVGAARLGAMNA